MGKKIPEHRRQETPKGKTEEAKQKNEARPDEESVFLQIKGPHVRKRYVNKKQVNGIKAKQAETKYKNSKMKMYCIEMYGFISILISCIMEIQIFQQMNNQMQT